MPPADVGDLPSTALETSVDADEFPLVAGKVDAEHAVLVPRELCNVASYIQVIPDDSVVPRAVDQLAPGFRPGKILDYSTRGDDPRILRGAIDLPQPHALVCTSARQERVRWREPECGHGS